MRVARLVATWFGAGLLRPAPGTWGSLAALPCAWGLHLAGGFWALVIATFAVFAVGWWASVVETRGSTDPDPSEIVVDEVAGMWLALWPVSFGAVHAGVDVLRLWPGILAAFVAFRLFDIWKPGPAGWADRLHSPLGIMLDDIFAGVFAALAVVVLAAIAHGMVM